MGSVATIIYCDDVPMNSKEGDKCFRNNFSPAVVLMVILVINLNAILPSMIFVTVRMDLITYGNTKLRIFS